MATVYTNVTMSVVTYLPPPSRRFRPDKEDGVVEVRIFRNSK